MLSIELNGLLHIAVWQFMYGSSRVCVCGVRDGEWPPEAKRGNAQLTNETSVHRMSAECAAEPDERAELKWDGGTPMHLSALQHLVARIIKPKYSCKLASANDDDVKTGRFSPAFALQCCVAALGHFSCN